MPRSRNMKGRSKTMRRGLKKSGQSTTIKRRPKTNMRRGITVFKKKGRKTAKVSNKPNWIKFVTKFHKEQSKKNKNWTFKDSLKNAKKLWEKEKKMYGGVDGDDAGAGAGSADEKKPSDDEKKPSDDEKKPSDDEKKPSDDEKKPSDDEKKPSDDEDVLVNDKGQSQPKEKYQRYGDYPGSSKELVDDSNDANFIPKENSNVSQTINVDEIEKRNREEERYEGYSGSAF